MSQDVIVENLCQAIDTILAKRLESLNFDITELCTVKTIEDAKQGKYLVDNGTMLYTAYSSQQYNIDDVVYVLIPKGDYDGQKTILRKYTNISEYKNWISPKEQFFEMAKPISEKKEEIHEMVVTTVLDDSSRTTVKKTIYSQDNKNQIYYGCDCLYLSFKLQADFKDKIAKGTYGIVISADINSVDKTSIEELQEEQKKFSKESVEYETLQKEINDLLSLEQNNYKKYWYFESVDVIGDPYNTEIYMPQEKLFTKLNPEFTYSNFEVVLFQRQDFFTPEGEEVTNINENDRKIKVKNISLTLGTLYSNFTSDNLLIRPKDGIHYYTNDKLEKEMELIWIHNTTQGWKAIRTKTDSAVVDIYFEIEWEIWDTWSDVNNPGWKKIIGVNDFSFKKTFKPETISTKFRAKLKYHVNNNIIEIVSDELEIWKGNAATNTQPINLSVHFSNNILKQSEAPVVYNSNLSANENTEINIKHLLVQLSVDNISTTPDPGDLLIAEIPAEETMLRKPQEGFEIPENSDVSWILEAGSQQVLVSQQLQEEFTYIKKRLDEVLEHEKIIEYASANAHKIIQTLSTGAAEFNINYRVRQLYNPSYLLNTINCTLKKSNNTEYSVKKDILFNKIQEKLGKYILDIEWEEKTENASYNLLTPIITENETKSLTPKIKVYDETVKLITSKELDPIVTTNATIVTLEFDVNNETISKQVAIPKRKSRDIAGIDGITEVMYSNFGDNPIVNSDIPYSLKKIINGRLENVENIIVSSLIDIPSLWTEDQLGRLNIVTFAEEGQIIWEQPILYSKDGYFSSVIPNNNISIKPLATFALNNKPSFVEDIYSLETKFGAGDYDENGNFSGMAFGSYQSDKKKTGLFGFQNGETTFGLYETGDAYFSGTLYSGKGEIGGWNIGTTTLYGQHTWSENSSWSVLWAKQNGGGPDSSAILIGLPKEHDNIEEDLVQENTEKTNFRVTHSGKLYFTGELGTRQNSSENFSVGKTGDVEIGGRICQFINGIFIGFK